MEHKAYNVHDYKVSVHIESIAAYDNNIIVGTRIGQLLSFSVVKNEEEDKMELKLVNFYKNFSKKPIVQIEVIPKEFLLFTLSDTMISISIIEGMHFSLEHLAAQTKGASLFCVDVVTTDRSLTCEVKTMIRLCVAVKRKLQFYNWVNTKDKNKLVETKISVELKDVPKALSMFKDFVCVGYKNEYFLYDISNDSNIKKHDLIGTSSSNIQDPCICIIKNVFVLIRDQYLVGVDPNDPNPNTKKSNEISVWQKTESTSEKRTLFYESDVCQLFKTLTWSQPVSDLVWDEPYILGRTSSGLEIRCFDSNLNKESLIQSIPELGKARFLKHAGKGIIFAAALSEFWMLQSVDISKQLQSLQKQEKFQLAIDLTNTSDKSASEKKEIIRKIQTKFAEKLFANNQFKEAMQEFAKSQTDPYDVIRKFPSLYPNDSVPNGTDLNEKCRELKDKDLENGLLALEDYLNFTRHEELNRIKMNDKDKNGKDSTPKTSVLLSILDTSLLKSYLQTNNSRIEMLLREGHCHFVESEKELKKNKKFSELKILYSINNKHEKALKLLKSESENTGTRLFGVEPTIEYLQKLGSEHKLLIFEYSDWVLKKDPQAGLKIFTENNAEGKKLPVPEVVDFLLRSNKTLVIPYLEHIIEECKEETPLFHYYLINQYKKEIDNLKNELSKDSNSTEISNALNKTRNKLLNFLKTSNIYVAENVLKDLPRNDFFEERAIILGKLKKYNQVLIIYIQVLGNIEKAKEYCEQVYPENNNILVMFIKILLTPPDIPPYSGVQLHPICLKPNTEIVLDLLDKYGNKIDPVEVLLSLPNDLPVSRLKNFLENSLRSILEKRRHYQVLSGILHAEDLRLNEQLMTYEMQSHILTDFSTCPICKKRFTNQSAFVRYPDGKIVHFSCHKNNLE